MTRPPRSACCRRVFLPSESPVYYQRGLFFSVQDDPMVYYDADYAAMHGALNAAVAAEMMSAGAGVAVLTAASKAIDEAPLLQSGRVRVEPPQGNAWKEGQYAKACARLEDVNPDQGRKSPPMTLVD